ncbi:MAG: hypothetical protein JJT77_09990 [Crocinitomicaceae bacterium]|nr:hypothetical protein [Crocinitomicaceae bacterium]
MISINSKIKVIVTGGAGVTGRAIARSLRLSKEFDYEIIASDIFENKYVSYTKLFDKCIKLPHVDDSKYRSSFLKMVKDIKPDAILFLTEKENLYWSKQNNELINSITNISPLNLSEICISKESLYNLLSETKLVPNYTIYNRNQDLSKVLNDFFQSKPVWMRGVDVGSTSGKGAIMVTNLAEGKAWLTLNSKINKFMISDVLPGSNYACNLLYNNGKLLQYGIYERLEYFMPHLAPSGITGNIAKGRLVDNQEVLKNSIKSIEYLSKKTNERPNGVYTVDLKGDEQNKPLITEINLRHTAATSSFAQAGHNIAEYQVLDIIGKQNKINKKNFLPTINNLILRDIDGEPVFINDYVNQNQIIETYIN